MSKIKPTIYLETSIISAYFDFKKQDVERKKVTKRFFKEELGKYRVFISDVVNEELRNTPAKQEREKFLTFVKSFSKLTLDQKTINLAQSYIKERIIPNAKLFDAYHLAIATVNNIDIIVSWNYNHIANKVTEESVNAFNVSKDFPQITIEFPLKLLTPK